MEQQVIHKPTGLAMGRRIPLLDHTARLIKRAVSEMTGAHQTSTLILQGPDALVERGWILQPQQQRMLWE